MNLTPKTLRQMEVAGAILAFLGIIFWYSTPSNVVVAPLLVIGVGGVLAGVPWWVKRQQSDQCVQDLTKKLESEREESGRQN